MFPLFYKLPRSIIRIFSGRNLLLHLLAIILTFIIVTTDFDWKYFLFFHHSATQHLLFPAVWIGFFVPVLLPVILLLVGFIFKSFFIRNIGWALGQAAFLGWLVASFYKAFTGRPGPHLRGQQPFHDISQVFRFGFWRGGIFWGWPSSHTTVACAMAFTLFFMFRESKWIRYLAPYICLVHRSRCIHEHSLVFGFCGRGYFWICNWFGDWKIICITGR